ncbi:MAG: 3-deoxy-manno-octulosonate cytidylyltransferase [Nitrospirota bacterium]|nr:3-deoxy-manno-octulosonate cytidylyltransferase [Nitrospirota bacterium]
MNKPSIAIVIPARYSSSRFPGKPLAQLANKPLIQHVYEQASQASHVDKVIVATDDFRIQEVVQKFDGQVQMITKPCRTGTDRVAEVTRLISSEVIINLQADEILLNPEILNNLINRFLKNPVPMGTLMRKLESQDEFSQTSVVKVVTDKTGKALYFSRASIPHTRNHAGQSPVAPFASIHLGVYIFQRATLFQFSDLPTGKLENIESLEQLRALEHGIPIMVWETQHPSIRIDTPEDLAAADRSWEKLMVGSQ